MFSRLVYTAPPIRGLRFRVVGLLTLVAPISALAQAPQPPQPTRPARDIIARASAALGGEQAVRGMTNTTTEFNVATFGLGQEETPLSPARATFAFGRAVADFAGNRYALAQETRPVAGTPARLRQAMANGIGMNVNNNNVAPVGALGAANTARAMRLNPVRLVAAALESPASVRTLRPRRWRGELMDGVHFVGIDTLALYFDRLTGLPTVAEAVTDDPILGDRRTVTWYTRWQDAGGVKLPRQIDVEVNGRMQQHMVVTSASANETLPDSLFAIPDSIATRARSAPSSPAAITVMLTELAPGVWRAEGGSHFSLVVEQPDRLVVVEAPLNAVRSRAVLDTLRARFPRKRVGLVVNTHHHWDHAGGVREYMASGVPVVTHRRNVEFVRGIAAAPKSITRDGLARGRAAPGVTAANDSLTLGSGDSRVVLYHLPSAHAEGILAAYVPSARVLFVADVLSPGPTLPAAGSREVVEMASSRGLTIDRLVGAHGGIAPWADVARAAR